jgi:integrase
MARGSVSKRCSCRVEVDGKPRRVSSCKMKHGSWGYTVDAGRDDVTGKRKQATRGGFRTKDEAEEAMNRVLVEISTGAWSDDKGMKLSGWLETWLEESDERDRAAKTMANYRGHVKNVWKPKLGHLRLRDVRRHHIEKVLRELAKPIPGGEPADSRQKSMRCTGETKAGAPCGRWAIRGSDRCPRHGGKAVQRTAPGRPSGHAGRRVPKRSASTIESYHRTIRAALAAAQRRGLITLNPAEGSMDAVPEKEPRDLTVWEPDQTARFLDHVAGDRLSALFEVAAYTGLRRAELCGLRWSDIDEDGAGLSVGQTLVELSSEMIRAADRVCPSCGREHTGLLMKRPKSRAGRRWVPLVGAAQAALAVHKIGQDAEREPFGPDYADHGLVFCQVDGNPLRPGTVTTSFEAHAAACRLPAIRLHDTRHGACSLLLSGGVPIEVVQMILGHGSPDTTRRIYAHLMRKSTAAQVEAASEPLTRYRREQSVSSTPESEGSDPANRGGDAMT